MGEQNYFFIKLRNDFFEMEEIAALEDLLEEENESSSFKYLIIIFYQKLILKSLENKGFIIFDEKITPQELKKKLKYRSGNGLSYDLKVIDLSVRLLEKLKLLVIEENVLKLNKVKRFINSSKEDAQDKLSQELKNKAEIERFKDLQDNKNLSDSAKLEIAYHERLENEYLPLLAVYHYCSLKESRNYIPIFDELFDLGVSLENISKALNILVRRVSFEDFRRKVEPFDYLSKTLWKIIKNELSEQAQSYDLLLNVLSNQFLLNSHSEQVRFSSMLNDFVNPDRTSSQVASVALKIVSSGTIKRDNNYDLDSFIRMFKYHLNEFFKQKEEVKA